VVAVAVVDADQNLHLGLSPEARTIRRTEPYARIKLALAKLAVLAEEFDPGPIVGILAKGIVGEEFEADPLRYGHFVFGLELHPFPAGVNTIILLFVRAHGAALGKGRNGRQATDDAAHEKCGSERRVGCGKEMRLQGSSEN
jgi:hypothetical protein